MLYSEMRDIVINLPMDEQRVVYCDDTYKLFIFRPSKLQRRFEEYDPQKNIQIFMQINDERPFKPNHFRLLVDLNLKVRERPDLKRDLLFAFDEIFYGQDPLYSIACLENEFTQGLNPLHITSLLAQLFLIEQETGFGKKSKYDPKSLYIMGWIRTFIDTDKELDLILSAISYMRPPQVCYTCQDDRNHKDFSPDAKPLWYKE